MAIPKTIALTSCSSKSGWAHPQRASPVYADVLNGNQDDKTWNARVMKAWYSPEQVAQAIFIADSAFVTQDNLNVAAGEGDQPGYQFLSHLPENFKKAKTLKEEALAKNDWGKIGPLVNRKKAASYRTSSAKGKLHGKTYRFLVVHSDQMDARKEKSIQSQLEKEQERWRKDQEKLEKQDLACETDASSALADFLKQHQKEAHTFEGTVVREERPRKRQKRGRPKKGEAPPPPITVYRVQLTLHPPSDGDVETLRQQASIFILVTNAEKDVISDVELLKGYKGQQTVENRFRFLKNPYFVGRVFLEKPQRVEAFAYVMMISVMVYSLFEYLIRKNMEDEDEPLNLMGNGRKSFRPTGEAMLEFLETMDIVQLTLGSQRQRLLPKNHEPQLARILGLLGMDPSIYTEPRSSKAVESPSQ